MSKQAFKRVRRRLNMAVNRLPLDAFAWPGGYALCYVFRDGGTICPKCANKEIKLIDDDMRGCGRPHPRQGGWALEGVLCEADCEPEDWPDCDHCGKPIGNVKKPVDTCTLARLPGKCHLG
jgi:hypothetical protein